MKTVLFEEDARGIATVTLNRPEKRNAMSGEMIKELAEVAARAASSDTIRALIMKAEGPAFCAGGDLGWMRDQMAADDDQRRQEATNLAEMLKSFNALPVPVIASVHGNAFGGGVGLMSVCDIVFAAEGTRFGLTETRLGLIPATIGPYVVARMGAAKARRVFFSSRIFDAQAAAELGLVSRVVAADDLEAEVEAEAVGYLDCAPGAVAAAKKLIFDIEAASESDKTLLTVEALVERWQTAEADEGTSAFFEKRPPNWKT
ncbi:MAG: crotonase/enoyl-CoA hydratase family protein [Boseongicola sp.]|nr:crotonase/enoyl-CoA hydratase family protein [Boseongicola sp.]